MREFYSFLTACLCWAVLSGTIFAQPSVDGYFTPDAASAAGVSAADVTIAAESVRSDKNAKSIDLSALMDLSLTVGAASGAMGDVVCVPVTVNNFTGINSLQFSINYDATKLQFQSFANFIFGPVTTQNFNTSAPGQSRFIWSDPNADGETLPGGTVLFEICFTVTGSGTSTVSITGNPVAVEASDVPGNLVTVTTNNGVFTGPGGTGGGGGGGSTNLTVTIANATGNVGDVVCVPVTVNNFTGVNSLQFSINYNASRLQFQSFMNFAFGPVTTQNFNTSAPGQSRFIWSDPNADGETLASGATLFEICFTVISGGTSTVSLTGSPVAIEASDVPGNLLTVTTNNGVFTGSGSGGGGGGSTNLTVTIANATGNVGDVVCVPVTVNNFTGVNSLQFSINYNASRLQFQSFMNFAFGPVTTQNFNTSAPGQSRFIWSDPNADGETLASGATLFEICFTVISGGTSTVALTGSPVAIEASDVPGNLLTVTTNNGVFTGSGSGGGGGGGSTNLTVTIADATGSVGSVVCVPVTVDNFTGINSLQFSINYDASRLQFQSFMNFAFGPVTTQNFNTSAPGQSRFIWSDPNADGETLASGATLFEICFTVISGGTSTVALTGSPVAIEASDVPGNLLTVTTNNGVFTGSGSGGGGGGGSTNLTVTIADATGSVGSVVCVPVTVDNFTGINSLQFSINYDASRLQFQSFMNFAFGPVTTQNFNTSAPGQSRFIWSDPNADGETLASGATLFEICFTVIAGGSSTVSITGSPVSIEASDVPGNLLTVDTNDGIFSSSGGGGGGTNLTITIENGTGSVGSVVCVPVTVDNFTNINSLQFSINYNSSRLQFQSFMNFAFGPVTTQNFNTSAPGQSRFIWSDPNADGETLANGSTLFEICFTVIATGNSTISITGIPVSIEASDVPGNLLTVDTNNGVFSTSGSGGGGANLMVNVLNATGNVGDVVCVPVTVTNFTNVRSLKFSLNYDVSRLQFQSFQSFALGTVSAPTFTNNGAARLALTGPNRERGAKPSLAVRRCSRFVLP